MKLMQSGVCSLAIGPLQNLDRAVHNYTCIHIQLTMECLSLERSGCAGSINNDEVKEDEEENRERLRVELSSRS